MDSDVPAGAPAAGTIFAGKYRIDRVLGVGGMGYVLAATHVHLHERVAIKLLLPELANNAELVERFMREGRAAVRIRSEHVARILDVAELPDRTPFIVMEYLAGSDLSQVLRDRGPLPFAEAVDYLLQACEAIAEAHASKTVHRDLKPSNLFLTSVGGAPCVKVLDFGISKMTGVEGANLAMTKTSAMMGSPLYMSPEQLKSSRSVDERADIWALGVILYELLVGRPPFVADTLPELGALVLSGQPPWLAHARSDAPAGLSEIVATCLRRHAAERFTNLADFADALAPFGTNGARESAATVIRTLGMPAQRAHRATFDDVSPPLSSPDLAVGAPSADTPAAVASWGSSQAASRSYRAARSNTATVAMVGVASLVVTVGVGVVLLRPDAPPVAPRTALSAPPEIVSITLPPAPVAVVVPSVPAPPIELPDASAASAASVPSAAAAPKKTPPRTAPRPQPSTAPSASTAKPSTGGFATSSKD